MGTCPECGKIFRNKNQWYSCYRLFLEDYLKNKAENIQNTILFLTREIEVPRDDSLAYYCIN